jgi:hypothetical protein
MQGGGFFGSWVNAQKGCLPLTLPIHQTFGNQFLYAFTVVASRLGVNSTPSRSTL